MILILVKGECLPSLLFLSRKGQAMEKKMKIIVAGSRSFTDSKLLTEKLDFFFSKITPTIISGRASGADQLGEKYAEERGLDLILMPADWYKYGRSAGYRRNTEMAKVADGLVAFWDGESKGTGHMIAEMRRLGKTVKVVYTGASK